jgi:hypothetical protein
VLLNRSALPPILKTLALAFPAPRSKGEYKYPGVTEECSRCLRFVEEKYKIALDNSQLTHLSKAITTGAEKGTFVLPKGKKTIARVYNIASC